ncbi:MAG: ABC transporter ATP-binding protein [Rhodospirillales bacterium]|nr:ABC transporter ATP-binding protein [Rhodospirillales bacterium]
MTLLEVEDLHRSFGAVRAVSGVSFTLGAGEMLALIGPNGAGKSTCFNMLNGQVSPDRGRIRLAGRDITGVAPRDVCRLGVGRTFQITATFASMTARENVQLALLSHHRRIWRFCRPAAAAFAAEAEALLDSLCMAARGDHAAGVLAYGDLKRLELAMALAQAPRLLLMDEPTAGMAPGERVGLMRLVRALVRERGLAVLFTEHDMDAVFNHADRILVLSRGRLIAEGDAAAIRADAQVREIYLGTGATSGGH